MAVIEPGQEIHPPHQHVEEEFLLLAKGSGTWHLDGKDSPAREGDLLYVAPWVVHGLTNTSDRPLTFVVVKWNGTGIPKLEQPASSGGATSDSKSSVPNTLPKSPTTPSSDGVKDAKDPKESQNSNDSKSGEKDGARGGAANGSAASSNSATNADSKSNVNLPELKSCVLHRDDVKPDTTAAIGDVRRFCNGVATRSMSGVVSGVAVLNPGQEVHPPHQHAEEEFVYVVKGRGTWHLDGKDVPAGEGDLLYTEPWTVHGLTNSSSEPLTFYILKWNGRGVPAAEKPAAK